MLGGEEGAIKGAWSGLIGGATGSLFFGGLTRLIGGGKGIKIPEVKGNSTEESFDEIRKRVLKNIDDSRLAREASGYKKWASSIDEGSSKTEQVISRIDEIEVKFNYNTKYDEAEFARQLADQEAEKQAKKWLDSQVALHNPDQIAGGNPLNIGGMGDSKINSSIGIQWRYRIDAIDEQIKALADKMTETERKLKYLNVKLKY
ncbi:MAG: hypothetical protein E7214_02340 [Clostridium sp.]|nr:hypothetical protein [Clostridium sp.]